MFDRRWVTDIALAALIASPAVLSSSPTFASDRSAVVLHSDRQSPQVDPLALARAAPDDRTS
jgi:hypothetical protein